jgi:hypothetical protein
MLTKPAISTAFPAADTQPDVHSPTVLQQVTILALVGATLLLTARFCYLIYYHAVNILFRDQWDFFNALFDRRTLWETFNWQHGPVRLGAGLVYTRIVAELSGWDGRVDAFSVGLLLILAVPAAFYLKRTLFGSLALSDVAIPLIFLTTAQYEAIVGIPLAAHGPMPVLLLMLYGISWLLPGRYLRYAALLTFNFLSLYTGFGLFVGVITPALLAIELLHAIRQRALEPALAAAGGLAVAGGSLYLFFRGYVFMPAVTCFRFPDAQPWLYATFGGLSLARFVGFPLQDGLAADLVGYGLGLLLAVALVYHGWRLIRRGLQAARVSLIVVILISFSLMFLANAAVGRLCLGLAGSQASRYMTLLIPAFFGLYLHLLVVRPHGLRQGLLAGLVVLLVLGLQPFDLGEGHPARYYSRMKEVWKACYLQLEDVAACDRQTGYQIYPAPEVTHLARKLAYLKAHHLNLYRDAP